ncbi:hypothetical protein Pmar_PMAR024471 [Perkinsus marinus ATCC 50983]|uniref:Uncharacterized protein n=1 Tax=Perkinsus marinus (strain ATCC 50983 / TXsc) TaxID=423536 RepID=C5LT25_PERM5|nr:hypothetical protein Pmar_PMAR024471 [Perkinsus marinus ATCC 50983]EEQ99992.1 hypothetical protein Pmar_PMAR024471 [Perkinsus marinus ATCC 50983]|eukprot:XP_002767275.1 hypothetical protein Pmar_PMAR024471 [Perkinsus marinus ATCC 50983]
MIVPGDDGLFRIWTTGEHAIHERNISRAANKRRVLSDEVKKIIDDLVLGQGTAKGTLKLILERKLFPEGMTVKQLTAAISRRRHVIMKFDPARPQPSGAAPFEVRDFLESRTGVPDSMDEAFRISYKINPDSHLVYAYLTTKALGPRG